MHSGYFSNKSRSATWSRCKVEADYAFRKARRVMKWKLPEKKTCKFKPFSHVIETPLNHVFCALINLDLQKPWRWAAISLKTRTFNLSPFRIILLFLIPLSPWKDYYYFPLREGCLSVFPISYAEYVISCHYDRKHMNNIWRFS